MTLWDFRRELESQIELWQIGFIFVTFLAVFIILGTIHLIKYFKQEVAAAEAAKLIKKMDQLNSKILTEQETKTLLEALRKGYE